MLAYVSLIIILIVIVILFTVGFKPQIVNGTMNAIPEESFPVFIINLDRKPERYDYVINQLNIMGITDYTRISGTDGFKADPKEITTVGVSQILINKGKGLAGCAASHIRVWKHIAENNLGWSLILEDDAHFHPQFKELFPKYWK